MDTQTKGHSLLMRASDAWSWLRRVLTSTLSIAGAVAATRVRYQWHLQDTRVDDHGSRSHEEE